MSLIVLAMVKTQAKDPKNMNSLITESCATHDNNWNKTTAEKIDNDEGKLEWDESMIPLVLSSFSFGYMSTQIIGGRLAEIFGFKKVYGFGLFIPALLLLLHPLAARLDARLFVALRVLAGISTGVCWPSMHVLTARWVPPNFRSSFVSQSYFGSTFGLVFTFPMCGLIISCLGWEACFYIISGLSLFWSMVWYFVVVDDPGNHPRISAEELEELPSIEVSSTKLSVPWISLLTSAPVWGTLITDSANSFGITIFLGKGPMFLKFMLGFDIKSVGFLSGLPMLARYIGGVVISRLSDWLITRGYLTRLSARRLFNTISQVCPAVAIVLMGYAGCSVTGVMTCMVLGMFLNAIGAGHFSSAVDLSPNFAGTILGITNTTGSGMSALATFFWGALTTNNNTWVAWQTVFWVTGVVYIVGNTLYVALIQAEPQHWNEVKKDKTELENEEKQDCN